jgi:hypothetical protein
VGGEPGVLNIYIYFLVYRYDCIFINIDIVYHVL